MGAVDIHASFLVFSDFRLISGTYEKTGLKQERRAISVQNTPKRNASAGRPIKAKYSANALCNAFRETDGDLALDR